MERPVLTRLSASEIDEARERQIAYQYLCHLEEVKLWLERVLRQKLPPITALEERLRNGVILAKLGHFVTPEVVPLGSIYDSGEKRFEAIGLNFRHTENINLWLRALQRSGFPRTFLPEVLDVFEKKNMPKLIYCLHALSSHLFRLGLAPPIHDLYGKVQFSEDVIKSVSVDLKDSGVDMPAFQKIGEFLINDVDQNKLHNTVASVNDAIDQRSIQNLMLALTDPLLSLYNVKKRNSEDYFEVLTAAKAEKCESSLNKSANGSFEVGQDSDLLSLPEIEGYVKSVNINTMWKRITRGIESKDDSEVAHALQDGADELGKVFSELNMPFYIEELKEVVNEDITRDSARDIISKKLESGNRRAELDLLVRETLEKIIIALQDEPSSNVLCLLLEPCLGIADIIDSSAAQLYFCEFQEHFQMTQALTLSDVRSCIVAMNYVACVTKAIDTKDAEATWNALCHLDSYLGGFLELPHTIDRSTCVDYFVSLEKARQSGIRQGRSVLSLEEIQLCAEKIKENEMQRNKDLEMMSQLNESVRMRDKPKMMATLVQIAPDIKTKDPALCLAILKSQLEEREACGQDLWLSDIKTLGENTHTYCNAAEHLILLLKDIETAIFERDGVQLLEMLHAEGISCSVSRQRLLNALADFKLHIEENEENNSLIEEELSRVVVYLNIHTKQYFFELPCEAVVSTDHISIRLIKDIIASLSNGKCAESDTEATQAVICIQAHIRGMLVRCKMRRWVTAATAIQRWWRRKLLHMQLADGQQLLSYYLDHMEEIKKIQVCWRKRQKRRAPRQITPEPPIAITKISESKCESPESTPVLSGAMESNDQADQACMYDATDDLIQKLRSQVVQSIKKNQNLARRVDEMDVKIGLLIKNRLSIASLLSERKTSKFVAANEPKGLKALCKEAKMLLDGYQKLFYLLQTQPVYLSRLICTSPPSLTIQSCIFNLFNHGSSPRDEYLLLRLFAHALNEEVETRFQSPYDAVKGNPLVLKLAVGFARQGVSQHPLKYILAPLILNILEETTSLDTNPVDIYRRWINENEASSGCQSGLPRCVSQDVALQYPEVVRRLNTNIKLLEMWVKNVLTRLVENIHRLPYALKFIAKILKDALFRKFTHVTEKEVFKVVGHLIYYQFINSALVAPDTFHIISLPAEKPMRAEQRKNLGTIAKILQLSASKTGFGEESKHLLPLNSFIIDCHEVMKQVTQKCCAVPSLEEHFNYNEFTDALLMRRPKVYMTAAEMCEAHNLLMEKENIIAPDVTDPIHELLFDMGIVPTPASLLGYSPEAAATICCDKVLICLDLDNEYLSEGKISRVVFDDDDLKLRREAQTKELHEIKITLGQLKDKAKHFEEQLSCYEKYLSMCLQNHAVTKKPKPSKTIKYTGAQLMEKGILVSLESVPTNQHKNLQFEISSTQESGVFHVKCRFMGVEVDSTNIDIQNLLSLQFEGCGVLNMFGKAEINVNLLLFLLNKKFVGLKARSFNFKK